MPGVTILVLGLLAGGCEPTYVATQSHRNPSGRPAPTGRDGGMTSRPPETPVSRDGGTSPPPTTRDGSVAPPGGGGDECARLGYLGECRGTTAVWCQEGQVRQKDCTTEGRTCGFINDSLGYYCTGGGTTPPPGPGTPTPPPTTRDGGTSGGADGELGACDGTQAQCESARLINAYRMSHKSEAMHPGECGHALRWDSNLGRMAQQWQDSQGASISHSSYGYPENVGTWFTAGDYAGAVDWIASYDPPGEDHCNNDGSYVASHHCNTMFCNHRTVGVGVYEQGGGQMAMTMIFGDENGQPSW